MNKKQRESAYKKVKDGLAVMASELGGWKKIDKKLSIKTYPNLTVNDIKLLKQWVVEAKEQRIEDLKIELTKNNEYYAKLEKSPELIIQMQLYVKGYPQSAPLYSSVLEVQRIELEESNLKLKYGFEPLNANFKWMLDKKWQELMMKIDKRKKQALEKNIEELTIKVAEAEKEVEIEKQRRRDRGPQINAELVELGINLNELVKKENLNYIG